MDATRKPKYRKRLVDGVPGHYCDQCPPGVIFKGQHHSDLHLLEHPFVKLRSFAPHIDYAAFSQKSAQEGRMHDLGLPFWRRLGPVEWDADVFGDDEIGQRTLFAEVLRHLQEVQYSSRRRGYLGVWVCRWKTISKFKSSLSQVRTQ